jgi:hypothetical protein
LNVRYRETRQAAAGRFFPVTIPADLHLLNAGRYMKNKKNSVFFKKDFLLAVT